MDYMQLVSPTCLLYCPGRPHRRLLPSGLELDAFRLGSTNVYCWARCGLNIWRIDLILVGWTYVIRECPPVGVLSKIKSNFFFKYEGDWHGKQPHGNRDCPLKDGDVQTCDWGTSPGICSPRWRTTLQLLSANSAKLVEVNVPSPCPDTPLPFHTGQNTSSHKLRYMCHHWVP